MAIILPPGTRILDADGAPVSGGKFRVYDANTTDLSDLFSDASLTTPRANPVVANSAGELPFFFIASGAYDIAVLTSADVELDSAEDVPAWGEDTGDLERTVTGGGRFKVSGSAGAVTLEFGDPDPDDVGGTATLQGWAGTQLTLLTINSASVNAGTSAGALKENGKKLPGVVRTEATTFAAATSVVIELPNSPTGTRAYEVVLFDVICSSTGNVRLELSYDGGGTYKSGAGDYHSQVLTSGAGTASASNAAATTIMDIAVGYATPTNVPGTINIEIVTPDSGSFATKVNGRCDAYEAAAGKPHVHIFSGYGLGGYGRATHVRVSKSAGTLAGKYLVRALRGYGET